MLQVFGRSLVVLAVLVLAMSFAGNVHPVGDSLAVFRPLILLGSAIAALLVWRWRGARALMLVTVLVGLWHGTGLVIYATPKDRPDIVLYQKNMLFRPHNRGPLMADIRASAADVVTLQEVSHANRPMLAALRDLYPHQVLCAAHSAGAVAVLSQTPLRGETCGLQSGVARAVTTVNGQDVQVVSVHLHWPFPYSQQDHARALIAHLEPLHDGVTVVGGDFNMVASGRSLSWFETAVGATRVGPLVRSYTLFGYPLGIDHILASGGIGTVSVRPQLGSDHYGLLGDIAFP